jgi:DNA modification methylase
MILVSDSLTALRQMPDQSVHCCVTSPPYFGLRDYGVDGQIGLEDTPDAYVDRLVEVFREVRRVLRDDGTLWLNLGDSWAANRTYQVEQKKGGPKHGAGQGAGGRGQRAADYGLKPKDLIGVPWRVAFALQADGWYLRQELIWAKPNPMPESVRDRCTRAHEQIFMLAKSGKPTIWRASDTGEWSHSPDLSERLSAPTDEKAEATKPRWRGFDYFYDGDAIKNPPSEDLLKQVAEGYNGSDTKDFAAGKAQSASGTKSRIIENARKKIDKQRGHNRRHAGFNERWDALSKSEQAALGSNKRSVWTVAPKPFKEAHFATYPPDLIEPCILAGCPVGGTVLDPFFGAGTTGLVAQSNNRKWIGIELNPAYAEIARRRLGIPVPVPVVDDELARLLG